MKTPLTVQQNRDEYNEQNWILRSTSFEEKAACELTQLTCQNSSSTIIELNLNEYDMMTKNHIYMKHTYQKKYSTKHGQEKLPTVHVVVSTVETKIIHADL